MYRNVIKQSITQLLEISATPATRSWNTLYSMLLQLHMQNLTRTKRTSFTNNSCKVVIDARMPLQI